MVDEDGVGATDEWAAAAAGGGAWLTYRYRFAGEGAPEATGTMKAPSFPNAAQRILARGLGARVGRTPAYLRLRAAGEQEMLFRVERTGTGALRVDPVPSGSYRFADADLPAADREPPSGEQT